MWAHFYHHLSPVCVQLFGTSYYARGPLFLLEEGVSRESLSAIMSIGQVMEIFVVLLLPLIFGRLGPKGTIAVGIGAWALRYFCWSRGGSMGMLVTAVALHGVCFACVNGQCSGLASLAQHLHHARQVVVG